MEKICTINWQTATRLFQHQQEILARSEIDHAKNIIKNS